MSFSSETKNALAALPVKANCCKRAMLFGLFYPQSDFANNKLKFSTDNEKTASLCTYLVRSYFGFDCFFDDVDKLSRTGYPAIGYKFGLPAPADAERMASELLSVGQEENGLYGLFACENCMKFFLRGLFLSVGTVTDPKRGYHLEFAVSDVDKLTTVCGYLDEIGMPAKVTKRRGVPSVYIKESESIEDFFTLIGSPQTSLTIMEVKIMREIRNNENRRNNCDTANIYKSTGASILQIKAIKAIKENNMFGKLPKELAVTAELREANPEISMSELAALHDPPITKSGVSHRLSKIISFYELNIEEKTSAEDGKH